MERNEAIGIVRNHLLHGNFKMLREALETLIPELKEPESEDERIRRVLIEWVGRIKRYKEQGICSPETFNGISTDNILAWLEKQNETFTKKDVDDAYLKGVCDTKRELEKSIKIKRGKNYLCTKTHRYANEEWKEGTIYNALEDYALLNQGCAYYCPAWSKEEHNDCFREAELNRLKPKFEVEDWLKKYVDAGKQYEQKDPCKDCPYPNLNCHNFPCIKKKAFDLGKSVFECVKTEYEKMEQKPQRVISAEAKEAPFNYTNILSAEEHANLENLINKLAVSGIEQYNTQAATILFNNRYSLNNYETNKTKSKVNRASTRT